MNKNPRAYPHLVGVRLSDDQLGRLDHEVNSMGVTRQDVIRAALDGHQVNSMSGIEPHAVNSMAQTPGQWASVSIDTNALRQLQELASEAGRLRALVREYATGVRKGVVLELTEGARYVCSDGELITDTRPLRRTVGVRAE